MNVGRKDLFIELDTVRIGYLASWPPPGARFSAPGSKVGSMVDSFDTDRRSLLRLLSGGAAAGLAGCTNLQIIRNDPSGEYAVPEFELGAETSNWRGLAPEQIKTDKNPILRMRPGDEIKLTWRNLDGHPHKFVIEDSLGNTLLETETLSEKGKALTVTFEADQEMTSYLDPHEPVMMRGEFLVTKP